MPGLYSAYIATQFPILLAFGATLRVIDEFEQKSTFRVSAPTSGCVTDLEACGSGGLFRAVPPLPEPLPFPYPNCFTKGILGREYRDSIVGKGC